MTDIIKTAALALPEFWDDDDRLGTARTVLAAVTPIIRAAALQETITKPMIEAGQTALCAWEESSDPYSAHCVADIYKAMTAVAVRALKEQPMEKAND